MQGSVRALKAAPKLDNYNSTRNKNSDTQKYTYIMHIKNIHTPLNSPKKIMTLKSFVKKLT